MIDRAPIASIAVVLFACGTAAATQIRYTGPQARLVVPAGIPSGQAQPKALTITSFADLSWNSVPVGGSKTITCVDYCLASVDGPGYCGSSTGQVSLATPPGSPFSFTNPRLVPTDTQSCDGTPVTMPVTIPLGQALEFDVTFSPTQAGVSQGSLVLAVGDNGFQFNLTGSTVPANCFSTPTLGCLYTERFAVSATFQSPVQSGTAQVVQLTDDTGEMWFFSPDIVELEFKVIDGCPVNGHYWFFAGGLTNVQVVITVLDTSNGVTKTYTNKQGAAFAPIQDTSAFSACP